MVYLRGHLMEFVRPSLPPGVTLCADAERLPDGTALRVAGGPIARQHLLGEDGTAFATIEDESGDVPLIVWPLVFARQRRALRSRVLLVRVTVSR